MLPAAFKNAVALKARVRFPTYGQNGFGYIDHSSVIISIVLKNTLSKHINRLHSIHFYHIFIIPFKDYSTQFSSLVSMWANLQSVKSNNDRLYSLYSKRNRNEHISFDVFNLAIIGECMNKKKIRTTTTTATNERT